MNRPFKPLSLIEPLEIRTLMAHIGLDPSFATGGIAPVAGSALIADATGGKTLVAGGTKVLRLSGDGSVDSTFVDEGAVQGNNIAHAKITGSRIIVAGRVGTTNTIYVRAILKDSGAIDTSFGANGTFTFTPESSAKGFTVVENDFSGMDVTSDGGVVLGVSQYLTKPHPDGPEKQYDERLYKLTSAGAFDSAFGNAGAILINSDTPYQLFPTVTAIAGGGFWVKHQTRPWVTELQAAPIASTRTMPNAPTSSRPTRCTETPAMISSSRAIPKTTCFSATAGTIPATLMRTMC
jgi:hypothetical protein